MERGKINTRELKHRVKSDLDLQTVPRVEVLDSANKKINDPEYGEETEDEIQRQKDLIEEQGLDLPDVLDTHDS